MDLPELEAWLWSRGWDFVSIDPTSDSVFVIKSNDRGFQWKLLCLDKLQSGLCSQHRPRHRTMIIEEDYVKVPPWLWTSSK